MCTYNKNTIINNNEVGVNAFNVIKAGDVLWIKELKALKSMGWKTRPMAIIGNKQVDKSLTTFANCCVPAMMVTSNASIANSIPFVFRDRISFIDTNNIFSVNTKFDVDETNAGNSRLTDAQLEMAKYMVTVRISGEKDPEIEEAIRKYNREFLYAILKNNVELNSTRAELDGSLAGMEQFANTYLGGVFTEDPIVKEAIKEIFDNKSKASETRKRVSVVVRRENQSANAGMNINTATDMGKALSKALNGMVNTAKEVVKPVEVVKPTPAKTVISINDNRLPVYMIKDGKIYRLKRLKEMADSTKSLFLSDCADCESFAAFAKKHNLNQATVNGRAKEVYAELKSRKISLPQKVKVFMENSASRRGYNADAVNKKSRDLNMACCAK